MRPVLCCRHATVLVRTCQLLCRFPDIVHRTSIVPIPLYALSELATLKLLNVVGWSAGSASRLADVIVTVFTSLVMGPAARAGERVSAT